jgi:transcriptional regulator with XRE-family HTH domain
MPGPILGQPPYAALAALLGRLPSLVATERIRRGLTPVAASKQIGVARSTLDNLEAGRSEPSQFTILACLNWLASAS